MLTIYDYVAIAFFFLFMLALGPIFKRYSEDDSDFFRGGGQMLWWMVGGSAFMCQFSAWTFTGAASKAYQDGTLVALLFFANAFGFFVNYLWFAPRFRRMRIVSPIEGVRERFGPANEQIFTWLQIPMSLVYAGIWLNGLAVFATAVFGFGMTETIWVVGIVVIILSVAGGSWAICAGDFVQLLILMAVSIATAFMVLGHSDIGGVSGLINKVPSHHFNWSEVAQYEIILFWIVGTFVHKFVNLNNMQDSYRYLNVKDERQARKAALLAAVLMLIGPVIWFIPPMAASVFTSDLAAEFPGVKNPNDTAYIFAAMKVLPAGMMGLLVCGLFAATISSMDSGLNRNAGIFVRSFYQRVVKEPSSKHLLLVGRIASGLFGLLIILVAAFINELKGIDLFDAMMLFGSMIAIPYAIPLLWGIVYKKTPQWSGWSTILIGFLISFAISYSFTATEIDGVDAGYDSGAIVVKLNQSQVSSEFEITESEKFDFVVGNDQPIFFEPGTKIFVDNDLRGSGYLMYSPEVLQDRLVDRVGDDSAGNLLAVRSIGSSWQFTNVKEQGWTNFSPIVGDRLLMQVDFENGKTAAVSKNLIDPEWFGRYFGNQNTMSSRETKDYLYFTPVFVNVLVCTLWFFFTALFYKSSSAVHKQRVDKFFEAMRTPIDFEREIGAGKDSVQSKTLGILCLIYGGFVTLMALVPNPMSGRLAFLFCGGLIGGVGWLLYRASKKSAVAEVDSTSDLSEK